MSLAQRPAAERLNSPASPETLMCPGFHVVDIAWTSYQGCRQHESRDRSCAFFGSGTRVETVGGVLGITLTYVGSTVAGPMTTKRTSDDVRGRRSRDRLTGFSSRTNRGPRHGPRACRTLSMRTRRN